MASTSVNEVEISKSLVNGIGEQSSEINHNTDEPEKENKLTGENSTIPTKNNSFVNGEGKDSEKDTANDSVNSEESSDSKKKNEIACLSGGCDTPPATVEQKPPKPVGMVSLLKVQHVQPAKKTILDYLEKASKIFRKKGSSVEESTINPPVDTETNTCKQDKSTEYPKETDGSEMESNSNKGPQKKTIVEDVPISNLTVETNCDTNLAQTDNDTIYTEIRSPSSVKKSKVPKARKSANPTSRTTLAIGDGAVQTTIKRIHLGPLANRTLDVPEIGKVLGMNKLEKLGLARNTPPKECSSDKTSAYRNSEMLYGSPERIEMPKMKTGRARIGGKDLPRNLSNSKKKKKKQFRGGRYNFNTGTAPKRRNHRSRSLSNSSNIQVNNNNVGKTEENVVNMEVDESSSSNQSSTGPTTYPFEDKVSNAQKQSEITPLSQVSDEKDVLEEKTDSFRDIDSEISIRQDSEDCSFKDLSSDGENVKTYVKNAKKKRRSKSKWSKGSIPKAKNRKSSLASQMAKQLKVQSHHIMRQKCQLSTAASSAQADSGSSDNEEPQKVKMEEASPTPVESEPRISKRKRKPPEYIGESETDPENTVSTPCIHGKAHISPFGNSKTKLAASPCHCCQSSTSAVPPRLKHFASGIKRRKSDDSLLDQQADGSSITEAPVLSPQKPARTTTAAHASDDSAVLTPSQAMPQMVSLLNKSPLPIAASRPKGKSQHVYTHPLISNPSLLHSQVAAGVVGPATACTPPQGMQADIPSSSPEANASLAEKEGMRYVNTPDGYSYPVPVTPPKTPDDSCSLDSREDRERGEEEKIQVPNEKDFIPLCCCKITTHQCFEVKVPYCQALDSIDGKVMGCCNKVSNQKLVRPAVKIPFMAVCEVHRQRLKLHQCCPGCGLFCTQGPFYQCKKEGTSIHNFHKNCQVFKENKYFCPHCGEESSQFEVYLKLNEPKAMQSFFVKSEHDPSQGPRAKMTFVSSSRGAVKEEKSESPGVSAVLNNVELSSGKLPAGPARTQLETILAMLGTEQGIKKMRGGPKSLYQPSLSGDLERVVFLLSEGSDPNHQFVEQNSETALHAAAYKGHLAIVSCLVQAGGMPNALDKELHTPLMCAAEMNHVEVVDYLYKCGGALELKDEGGMTPLHTAAKSGSLDVVKYILKQKEQDINSTDDGGWTALVWAAEYQHVDTVKFLLDIGADPNMRDQEGNTALHWAAFSGAVNVAELFLNAGCDLEAANEHGDRPLHIAARQDHYSLVVLFLARGADSEARNNENQAPIGCCVDQTTQVWMALRVNKQLKGFAARQLKRPERLLHRDISLGKESVPVPVVNGVDDENYPDDFVYVPDNIETTPLNVNRVITSLQHCRCRDNCSSMFCVCSRNSVRTWYDKEGRLVSDFNQSEPPLIFECNKACRCWTTCANRVVQNGVTCRLQVFRTRGRGWGLRTLLDIKQGTFVSEYVGEHISDAEADSREDDSYLFDLDNKDGDTFCIDARKYANLSRFINHLCEPNLVTVKVFTEHQDLRFPKICFFASRDIKAYEELGFDYGEKFWIIKWKQFTCECESPRCKYSKETIHRTLEDYNRRMEEEDQEEPQP